MNGQQAGDPAKLARAVITIADQEQPPRRFIGGADWHRRAEGEGHAGAGDAFRDLSTSLARE